MSNQAKHISEISEIKKTEEGVRVEITSQEKGVDEAVQAMVENCRQGTCNCMNPEMKERISGMEFQKIEGRAAIAIQGKISVEEIKEAMERSKVEVCCTIDPTAKSDASC